jgi:hypothetical protein
MGSICFLSFAVSYLSRHNHAFFLINRCLTVVAEPYSATVMFHEASLFFQRI